MEGFRGKDKEEFSSGKVSMSKGIEEMTRKVLYLRKRKFLD